MYQGEITQFIYNRELCLAVMTMCGQKIPLNVCEAVRALVIEYVHLWETCGSVSRIAKWEAMASWGMCNA